MEEKTQPALPPEPRARIPAGDVAELPMRAKLLTSGTDSTGPVTEFGGVDAGIGGGDGVEPGHFNLPTLEAIEGPGAPVNECDPHCQPPASLGCRTPERDQGGTNSSAVQEHADQFNEASIEPTAAAASVRRAPSPFERPGIRMIETELNRTGLADELHTVSTPSAAASILYNLIGEADREHFAVLLLDNRHRMTHSHIVSRGTAQSALVHPREVFKAAVLANAAALIIGHNHTSGSMEPSAEDKAVNERIERAGELLGIRVLDSIIVGPTSTFHSSTLGGTQALSSIAPAMPPEAGRVAENELSIICRGLMRDIEEVLERQGEEWWDETVTSGTYHRELAERRLGLAPYRPLPDAADAAGPA